LSSRAKFWDFKPKFWDLTPRPQICLGLMAELPLAHIFDEHFLMSARLRIAPQFAVSPR
jgi:hypothetical protein